MEKPQKVLLLVSAQWSRIKDRRLRLSHSFHVRKYDVKEQCQRKLININCARWIRFPEVSQIHYDKRGVKLCEQISKKQSKCCVFHDIGLKILFRLVVDATIFRYLQKLTATVCHPGRTTIFYDGRIITLLVSSVFSWKLRKMQENLSSKYRMVLDSIIINFDI